MPAVLSNFMNISELSTLLCMWVGFVLCLFSVDCLWVNKRLTCYSFFLLACICSQTYMNHVDLNHYTTNGQGLGTYSF